MTLGPIPHPLPPRFAYVARYPLNEAGNDLQEEVIGWDTYWTAELDALFDQAVAARKPGDPMIQAWYSDAEQVECMGRTGQPFRLD